MIAIDPRAAPCRLRAQVCVVGSGAGGAVAATELARSGVDTLLLEEGPHHDPATFDQRELPMMRRLYMESGQRMTSDQSMVVLCGRGLGGSTVHNTALCVPPPPAILERWRALGALPASPREVQEAAEREMVEIGARFPAEAAVNRNNRLLEEGAARIGLATVRPLHSRVACSGCGYCVLGCAYNLKRHVGFSHLEPAVAAGLRIATGARVERILRRGDGLVARGPGFEVAAARVVLAASALGTPLVLARSGLGGGRVGRGLRLHPFAPVAGVFPEPVEAHRGVPQSVLVTGRARFLDGARGGSLLMAAAAGPAGTAALMAGTGEALRRRMALFRRLAVAGVLLHDEGEGRVRRRPDGRPRIAGWPRGDDVREIREGVRALARLYFAMGAEAVLLPFRRLPEIRREAELDRLERLPFRPYDVMLSSVHPQGTAAMGADARRFPVDPEGRLRKEPRVLIADGSLFPTSVGVPPQVTIMALARLVARGLAATLG